jgi:catalase/peroxidase HPI
MKLVILFAALVAAVASAGCPFGHDAPKTPVNEPLHPRAKIAADETVDYQEVAADIAAMLTVSQPFWPADDSPTGPNYGPFFVRLAWHCSGSYRKSDGRGGCDGGNMRFNPVRSWDDNTNLDKALRLLEPIKEKYGAALSWGDLIVLAGTTAIEQMGGPTLGFCGGRQDFRDPYESEELGPTHVQEEIAPCPEQGNCQSPLGTSTIGLIYVNPQGYMANGDPQRSVPQIRNVFARMSMNDTETVALIAGGHSFGRTHGACPTGPGPNPTEDPYNPWPGTCDNGTFTSGIDGPWTPDPTQWTLTYPDLLLHENYSLIRGPGGAYQFQPQGKVSYSKGTMMMVTDIALLYDDTYKATINQFYDSFSYFDDQFSHAWYKLVTRDMGPAERCVGNMVPPAQGFQYPIVPIVPTQSTIFAARQLILASLYNGSSYADPVDGKQYQGALYVQLAYQCANTYRDSDHRGGCNGAAIRYPPSSEWDVNTGMDNVLDQIGQIKKQLSGSISWADLIVLAGTVALEDAGDVSIPFCAGRGDYSNGDSAADLAPRTSYITDPILYTRDNTKVMGFTPREYIALAGRPRSPTYMEGRGYSGSWTSNPSVLNNDYYSVLLGNDWTTDGKPQADSSHVLQEFATTAGNVFVTGEDIAFKYDYVYKSIAMDYIHNADAWKEDFVSAWTKLMDIDRFDGPTGNLCY